MIIHWDCLQAMDKLIEQWIKVDAIITDPPYWITACKRDSVIPFDAMWERLNKLIKPNGAIVLFWSEPFSSALRMSNIKNYKYDWVWNKDKAGNIMAAKYQPMKVHENILVFAKSKTIFNRQMTDAKIKNIRPSGKLYENRESIYGKGNWQHSKDRDNTKRNPKSIINISSVSAECNNVNRVHPTQKPVALMEYLIKTYSHEWELVLDFTAGSWSTLVAAKNTWRDFIGIEKEQKYVDIIKERLSK